MRPPRVLVPGIAFLTMVAIISHNVAGIIGINPLLVAVGLGALVGNSIDLPERLEEGVALHSQFLNIGIVLLGANVVVGDLLDAGTVVLGLVAGVVLFGLPLGEFLGRQLGLDTTPSSLLAAGASVCGVSAATTIGGILDARAENLTAVVAAILVFDAVTLATFPILGSLLDLSARQFGVWAGLSMFSTGPVTAAGFAYDSVAGQWATITKLARNAFLGVVALLYVIRNTKQVEVSRSRLSYLMAGVPPFIIGFLVLAVAASVGFLDSNVIALADRGSTAFFTLAFVGLGLDIRLSSMRRVGIAPLATLFGHLFVISSITLMLVLLVL